MFLVHLGRRLYQGKIPLGGSAIVSRRRYTAVAVVEEVTKYDGQTKGFGHKLFLERSKKWFIVDNQKRTVLLSKEGPENPTLVLYQSEDIYEDLYN